MRFFLLLFLLIIFSRTSVFANTESFSESAADRLNEMREKRMEIQEKYQQRREKFRQSRENLRERVATRQAASRQKVIERIKVVFGNILDRLDKALARLDKIAERIATRIDKLKEKDVDTSAAEAKLADAEVAGAAAAGAISDAKLKVEQIDSSATVKDAVHAASEAVKGAKAALFSYHKALVAVLRELKASRDLREGTESAQ